MRGLNIVFLWHMHQPFYKDPLTGVYSLPWVRLHAIKGYYDMVSILEDFPEIRVTFNLVPSLLVQLMDYSEGKAVDLFLQYSKKEAKELTSEEKKFILTNFFMCNWETMVKPYPEYFHLLQKRGTRYSEYRLEEIAKEFTNQEYLDLQVWFNLIWFGYRSRKMNKEVSELIRKGRFFSEDDKKFILNLQQEIIQKVIPIYRLLSDQGQIELTTSPFYHPILPLLMDSHYARRPDPEISLPEQYHHPEDAEAQIRKAVEFHHRLFGVPPQGMWPSEGSVCPETIPLLTKAGITWIATDEDILFHSVGEKVEKEKLFKAYQAEYEGEKIAIIFRDRGLSDLIGFTYAKNQPKAAAEDLYYHLQNISQATSKQKEEPLVAVILDGENPWEAYPDGGEAFLSHLYQKLLKDRNMNTVKVSDYLKAHPPTEIVRSFYSGSWINHNFNIWIGSSEDNRAWNSLNRTRRFLSEHLKTHPGITLEKVSAAWEEIYIAEGSDWFWWYGDDFSSNNDAEFDRLFRLHLGNVYQILGQEIPGYLRDPLIEEHEVKPAIEPSGFIHPVIDGRITNFYEWYEAGYYSSRRVGGAMHKGEGLFSGIFFGFDVENLFIRLDPLFFPQKDEGEGIEVNLHIISPQEFIIAFPLIAVPQGSKESFRLYQGEGNIPKKFLQVYDSVRTGKIIELSIPFKDLNLKPKDQVRFMVETRRGEIVLERYPQNGYFAFSVPEEHFEKIMWST
jgi:alpha-amylase/alpha-mannosidase (GH57 family)